MTSVFKTMQSRQMQKRANSFINSLSNKPEKEVLQAYLDNKEFENDEIVLSFIFFKYPNLIRVLPTDFQVSRINSNLTMFDYGSDNAKRKLVSSWLKNNKFFINVNSINLDETLVKSYIRMYFKQPEDVSKLYMNDLKNVIQVLNDTDVRETENVINSIKDKFTDKQWEYILEVNPIYIKYANQNIQNKYADDKKFEMYINGDARGKYIDTQIDKIKENIDYLNNCGIEVQREYINRHPYMINYIDEKNLIEILKYDTELIKYVNMPYLKNENDKTLEVIYGILENVENKSIKEVVDILINKCVLTAKGKLYRYDNSSNNMSYQYTKRTLTVIQKMNINQMCSLINVDVNYCLPYIIPVYNENTSREEKEKIIIDSNKKCLDLFRTYYDDEYYTKYYKIINKIYNEYIVNLDKYNYDTDYKCIFELFKILFNRQIILNNNVQKITVFIGMSLLYKSSSNKDVKPASVKLLNEILSSGYKKEINNEYELYDINSLEIYDDRLKFISSDLLKDYSKYNFVNFSSLLLIVKSNKLRPIFEKYYYILSNIYEEDKETLYRSVEHFTEFYEIMKDVDEKSLSEKEVESLLSLLSSFSNVCNITKRSELLNYELIKMKKFVTELSSINDKQVLKNHICNYLFNKAYDEKGGKGWLEVSTIKQLCDIYDAETLEDLNIKGKMIFSEDEVNMFSMIKLLLETDDFSLLLSYIENIINNRLFKNNLSVPNFFQKIKKYRIELLNNQIVSIDDIDKLNEYQPNVVEKTIENNVVVYRIYNQDFKVLCSTRDDKIHYTCTSVTKLEKNSYGYSKFIKNGSVRFCSVDGKTIIKQSKDNINNKNNINKPDFMIIIGNLTDELLCIASVNKLKIVVIENK